MEKEQNSAQSPEYPFWDTKLPMEERVKNLVSLLTVEEKIDLLHELAPAIPRLGIKRYYHGNECLHGIVRPGRATVFPQAIGLGATWDPELIFKVTTAISDEARAKHHAVEEYVGLHNGVLTFWSPTVNLARDPRWGRTPETYGEDPYLTQRIGVNFVKGLQGDDPKYLKVVATAKHFVGNNQEKDRHKLKPNIPEKWLRDYFLKGFKALITEAKCESVMGAYNAVFDVPCNHSKFILTELLREEYGFQGYVVTDCRAIKDALPDQHNIVETPAQAAASAINAGVDLECGPIIREGGLLDAFKEGLITEERIDFAASNVIRGRMKLGLFDPDEDNPYSNIPFDVVGCEKHSNLALKTAEKSIVLLKNDPVGETGENILPLNLKKIKSIAVVGPNAAAPIFGDYSGKPMNHPISPLEGIESKFKDSDIEVNYVPWKSNRRSPIFKTIPPRNLRPTVKCNKHYGLVRKYYPHPYFKGEVSTFVDDRIEFNFRQETPDPAQSNAQTDTNAFSEKSENFSVIWKGFIQPDHSGLHIIKLWHSQIEPADEPILSFNNSKFKTQHIVRLEKSKKYPVEIHFPNGKLGSRIRLIWNQFPFARLKRKPTFKREIRAVKKADVVLAFVGLGLGDEREGHDRKGFQLNREQSALIKAINKHNPNIVIVLIAGSNLAINWESENIPAILHAWYPGERGGDAIANVLTGDYNPAGRLPLTFYTGVDQLPPFSNYDISKGQTYWFLRSKPIYPFGHGISYTTFSYSNLNVDKEQVGENDTVQISVDITNTGERDGEEVVQLYVSYQKKTPEIPIKQLKAFERAEIGKGEKKSIQLSFDVKDLAFWNMETKHFELQKGKIEILVGSSSQDIHLTKEIVIS